MDPEHIQQAIDAGRKAMERMSGVAKDYKDAAPNVIEAVEKIETKLLSTTNPMANVNLIRNLRASLPSDPGETAKFVCGDFIAAYTKKLGKLEPGFDTANEEYIGAQSYER